MNENNKLEKIGLLVLATLSICILGWIGIAALRSGKIDPNASALIGVIVTGLIAFGKDIVSAIRAYAMSAQLGKVTDQLAASAPTDPTVPQAVTVTNPADDPVHVEETRS